MEICMNLSIHFARECSHLLTLLIRFSPLLLFLSNMASLNVILTLTFVLMSSVSADWVAMDNKTVPEKMTDFLTIDKEKLIANCPKSNLTDQACSIEFHAQMSKTGRFNFGFPKACQKEVAFYFDNELITISTYDFVADGPSNFVTTDITVVGVINKSKKQWQLNQTNSAYTPNVLVKLPQECSFKLIEGLAVVQKVVSPVECVVEQETGIWKEAFIGACAAFGSLVIILTIIIIILAINCCKYKNKAAEPLYLGRRRREEDMSTTDVVTVNGISVAEVKKTNTDATDPMTAETDAERNAKVADTAKKVLQDLPPQKVYSPHALNYFREQRAPGENDQEVPSLGLGGPIGEWNVLEDDQNVVTCPNENNQPVDGDQNKENNNAVGAEKGEGNGGKPAEKEVAKNAENGDKKAAEVPKKEDKELDSIDELFAKIPDINGNVIFADDGQANQQPTDNKPAEGEPKKETDKDAGAKKSKKDDKPAEGDPKKDKGAGVKKSKEKTDKPAEGDPKKETGKDAVVKKSKEKANKPAEDAPKKETDKDGAKKSKKDDKPAEDAPKKETDKDAGAKKPKKDDKPAEGEPKKETDKDAVVKKSKEKANKPAEDAPKKETDKDGAKKSKKDDKPAEDAPKKETDKDAGVKKSKKDDKPAEDAPKKETDKDVVVKKSKEKADKPAEDAPKKETDKGAGPKKPKKRGGKPAEGDPKKGADKEAGAKKAENK